MCSSLALLVTCVFLFALPVPLPVEKMFSLNRIASVHRGSFIYLLTYLSKAISAKETQEL